MHVATFIRTLQRALWYAPALTDSSEQIRIPKTFLKLFGNSPEHRVGGNAPPKDENYRSNDLNTVVKIAGTTYNIESQPVYVVSRNRIAGIDAHLALEDPLSATAALVKLNAPADQWIFDLLICNSKRPSVPSQVYSQYRGTQNVATRDNEYADACAQVLSAITNVDELNAIDEYTGGGLSAPVTASLFARHYTTAEDFAGMPKHMVYLFTEIFGLHGGDTRMLCSKDYKHLYGLGCEIAMAITNIKRDLILPLVEARANLNRNGGALQPGFPIESSFVQAAHCACPYYGTSGAVVMAAFAAAYNKLFNASGRVKTVNIWRELDRLTLDGDVAPLNPVPGATLISQYVRANSNAKPGIIKETEAKAYAKFLAESVFLPIIAHHIRNTLQLNARGRLALQNSFDTNEAPAEVNAQWVTTNLGFLKSVIRNPRSFSRRYPGLYIYDTTTRSAIERDSIAELDSSESIAAALNGEESAKYVVAALPYSRNSPVRLLPYEIVHYIKAYEQPQRV